MHFDWANMDINFNQVIMGGAALITTLGGAWLTIRKIVRDIKRERRVEAAKMLQDAKEAVAAAEAPLKADIKNLHERVDALEKSIEKDLDHLKDTYNNELRNLGQKIEELREELRSQHTNITNLLMKMIDKG